MPSVAAAAVITVSGSFTNNANVPITFAMGQNQVLPPDLYVFASSQGSLTVTPGQSGTATASLGFNPFFIMGFADFVTNLGVDNGTAPCVAVRVAQTCTFSLVTNSFAPTTFNQANATFSMTLSEGATVSFTADVTLEPAQAPEPSSLLLLATAAAGAWRARRRR